MFTKLSERFRSRVLLGPQGTGTGSDGFLAPTPSTVGITVRAIVEMGNAANLVLSLKYADNENGTNDEDYPVNVPIFVNGIPQEAGKAFTISDDEGEFIVDFCVDPGT